MGLEALFGHSVIRFELHTHVVVLGGDDLGLLRTTELAMQLGVSCESTAHLHKVILAHLQGNPALAVSSRKPLQTTPTLGSLQKVYRSFSFWLAAHPQQMLQCNPQSPGAAQDLPHSIGFRPMSFIHTCQTLLQGSPKLLTPTHTGCSVYLYILCLSAWTSPRW